jgi:hypothetical protein
MDETGTGAKTHARRTSGGGFLATLHGHERSLWVVVAAGFVADTLLTYYGLQLGMYELNPVMRASIGALGILAGILAVKLAAILTGLCVRGRVRHRLRPVVPAVLAVPWLVGAAVNAVGLAAF